METAQNQIGKFLDPDAIIAQLDVKRGDIAADFGCGPGYFSLPFAKLIGIEGKLYSLDVLTNALETVASKAKNLGIINIVTKHVNLERENGSKLATEMLDWVILKDVLFQNQKKDVIIAEAARVLKSGGRVIVVEWKQGDFTIGPDEELKISPEKMQQLFVDNDFAIEKKIEAGDFHYAFVAVKK